MTINQSDKKGENTVCRKENSLKVHEGFRLRGPSKHKGYDIESILRLEVYTKTQFLSSVKERPRVFVWHINLDSWFR